MNIKTEVRHSQSKDAWNVVGIVPGDKYKIAVVPYVVVSNCDIKTTQNKAEALSRALFISGCFNDHQTEPTPTSNESEATYKFTIEELRRGLASKQIRIEALEQIIYGYQLRIADNALQAEA